MAGQNDSLETLERDAEYKRIITQNLTDSIVSEESKWQLKDFMFSNIASGNAPIDATVQNFYADEQNSNVDALHTVDSLISIGNFSKASSVNNSMSGNLMIEQTAKEYNTLWLNKFSDPEYVATSTDISDLQTIANECIHKGGKSVAYARALLGAIYNHPFEFADDCTEGDAHERSSKDNKTNDVKTNTVNLYPNPNNGNFTLSYQLKEDNEAELMVEDVTGKLIYQTKLNTAAGSMDINLKNIRSGIYFVKIMNGKEILAVNKVIINN